MSSEVPSGEVLASPDELRDFYDRVDDLVRLSGIEEFERVGKFIAHPRTKFLQADDQELELSFCDNNTLQVMIDSETLCVDYYLFKIDDSGVVHGEMLDTENVSDEHPNVYIPITQQALRDLDATILRGQDPVNPSPAQLSVRQMGIDHARFAKQAEPTELLLYLDAIDAVHESKDAEQVFRLLTIMHNLFDQVLSRPE